jgi:O-antigen/teichoic acid export membrane protein
MLLQMWLIRQRRFRALAAGHLAQGLTRSGAQILAGVARAAYAGLAGGEIVGRWCVVFVLARPLRSELAAAVRHRSRELGRVVWRYRLFPIFRTPSTLANNLGTALPLAFVTMAYGVSAAGLFTLMSTVLVAPSGLVQKAVGDVFLGHFAERFRVDPVRARRFLLTVSAALAVLSLVPALIIGLWGAPAFALLYGAKWRLAGRLASLMVPVLMADLVIGHMGGALNVVNRPDAKLYFDAARLGGYAAAYWVATRAGMPLEGMVTLFAQFSVLAYALYAAIIWFAIRHPRPVAQVTGDLQAISDSPLP